MESKVLNIIILAFLFFVAMGFVGNSDKKEAEMQQDEYCQNVSDKTWPDYNHNYKEVCLGQSK